MTVRIFN